MQHHQRFLRAPTRLLLAAVAGVVLGPQLCWAQVTPAAGNTPPDDTPSIKLGTTIFADFTYNESPDIKDGDGHTVHLSQFNVQRAYINVTGNISHLVAFRVTPDITRETSIGPTISGSLVFRLKYAFAQFNLDDWMVKGSWARFGIQQTPWIDFEEGIYRYRFQGTVFAEREGFLSSSDGGASFHYNLPSNYGDVHAGVYNGETYTKAEVNNQKAFQVRASVRPFASGAPVLRGLRGHVFYDADSYIRHDARNRFIGSATYEHQYVNAGLDYLKTKDQATAQSPTLDGSGYVSVGDAAPEPMGSAAALRSLRAGFVARRAAPQAQDCRRGVLVPAPGKRGHRAPPRLRQRHVSEYPAAAASDPDRAARAPQLLAVDLIRL